MAATIDYNNLQHSPASDNLEQTIDLVTVDKQTSPAPDALRYTPEQTIDLAGDNQPTNASVSASGNHTQPELPSTRLAEVNGVAGSRVDIKAGVRLLHYQIEHKIGEGAMGMVFLAFDTQLQRQVAIKTLHARLAKDKKFLLRFMREAQSLAQIRHANVIQVYGLHQVGELHFFAMEYICGGTSLESLLDSRKYLDEKEALAIIIAIAQGLEAIHNAGIIHRDIKPANIMLDRGIPRIADFGIVAWRETDRLAQTSHLPIVDSPQLTGHGQILGTPFYLAPECFQGETGFASDIYAIGVMSYQMLCGQRPFDGQNITEVIASHLSKQPLPPQLLNSAISGEFSQIVMKMLSKSPQQRYANASQLLAKLTALQKSWENQKQALQQQLIAREFATVISHTADAKQQSDKRRMYISFSVIAIILAVALAMIWNSSIQTPSKITAVPGNLKLDTVWQAGKWARACGKIIETQRYTDAGKQGGELFFLDNYVAEIRVFLPQNFLDSLPLETTEIGAYRAFQGIVKKDNKENKYYLEAKAGGIISWHPCQVFVKQQDILKLARQKLLSFSGSPARINGSILYRHDNERGVWLLTANAAIQVGVQIVESNKRHRALINAIRIGDIIQAQGIITTRQKSGQAEAKLTQPYYGENEIAVIEVDLQQQHQWLRRKSVAPRLQIIRD